MIDFNKLTIKFKIFIAKIKHKITRRTYKELPAPKFKIGDKVVIKNRDSFAPFQDVYSDCRNGMIEDIFMGSKLHSYQDWYYTVVFTDDNIVSPYNRTSTAFNHWEIELDKSYLRAKRLKELGI
jgi:hypothetical protein